VSDDYDSITEELPNGAALPEHPSTTTSRKIIAYGPVYDAADGTLLTAGLDRTTISVLIHEKDHALRHLYRYAILSHDNARRIFHTRDSVTICVKTAPLDEPV
jgi:hypothetical protein